MKLSKIVLSTIAALSIGTSAYAISFTEVEDTMRQKTEAQEKYYSKEMKDTKISWVGTVMNVTETRNGRYDVSFDVDGDSNYDCAFSLPENKAIQFNKGDEYSLQGSIWKIWKTPFGGSIVTLKNIRWSKK